LIFRIDPEIMEGDGAKEGGQKYDPPIIEAGLKRG